MVSEVKSETATG